MPEPFLNRTGKRVGEDYNSQRAVLPSMPEVVVPADFALGVAPRLSGSLPKTWLASLWFVVFSVNWAFKASFCWLPLDKSALKGMFSERGLGSEARGGLESCF